VREYGMAEADMPLPLLNSCQNVLKNGRIKTLLVFE
jgi:hypothetical protein